MRNEGLIRVNRGEYKSSKYRAVVLCLQHDVHVCNNLKITGKKSKNIFFSIFLIMWANMILNKKDNQFRRLKQ